jgi:cell division protease FtsH
MITAFGMSENWAACATRPTEKVPGWRDPDPERLEATAQLMTRKSAADRGGRGQGAPILTDRLEDLHLIAKALLEYETLSNDEIGQVLRGEKIVRDDTGGAGSGPDRRRRASVPTSSTGQAPGGANPEPQPGV